MPLFWIGGKSGGGAGVRPEWNYFCEIVGSNIKCTKENGSLISSNSDLAVVLAAIDTDAGTNAMNITFTEGDFKITTVGLNFDNKSNITFRGAGIGVTRIWLDTGVNANALFSFTGTEPPASTFRALNAVSVTDTTLTLTTGTQEDEFAANDWIILASDDIIDTANSTTNGIFLKVQSVTTDDTGVITIRSPVNDEQFTTSPTCQTINFAENLTFEDLTIFDNRTTDQPALNNLSIIRYSNVIF